MSESSSLSPLLICILTQTLSPVLLPMATHTALCSLRAQSVRLVFLAHPSAVTHPWGSLELVFILHSFNLYTDTDPSPVSLQMVTDVALRSLEHRARLVLLAHPSGVAPLISFPSVAFRTVFPYLQGVEQSVPLRFVRMKRIWMYLLFVRSSRLSSIPP